MREEVRHYRGRIAVAFACMIVVAAATAAYAYMMEPVLNEVFDKKNRMMLFVLPVVVVLIFAIKGAAGYGQVVLMNNVGQRIIADVQSRLFAHLMRADLAFFHDTPTGALISRLTNDVNLLRAAVSTGLTGIVKESLTVVFLVGVMFYQDWLLALIASCVFPLAILPVVWIGRRMRAVSASTQARMGRFTSLLDETFQGARHVKAYGMEDHEIRRARSIIEELFRLISRALRVRAASTPIMENLGGIAIAVVIFYGGWQVIAGATTTGAFLSMARAIAMRWRWPPDSLTPRSPTTVS